MDNILQQELDYVEEIKDQASDVISNKEKIDFLIKNTKDRNFTLNQPSQHIFNNYFSRVNLPKRP